MSDNHPVLQLRNPAVPRFQEDPTTDEAGPRRVMHLYLRPQADVMEAQRRQQMRQHRVTWNPTVQDNPMQRVSKCCCIFHKKKLFGESSSDESSSDSSDEDDSASGNPSVPHAHDDGRCCGGAAASSNGAESQTTAKSEGGKPTHKRPKCTRECCYCETRFH